ncbi:MAG: hypothetical protein ACKV2V_01735 [Blastocatellia bacterium]
MNGKKYPNRSRISHINSVHTPPAHIQTATIRKTRVSGAIWRIAGLFAAALSLCTLAMGQAANNPLTISTLAGGGYSTSVPVRQAPMLLPSAVVRDPLGRGFYVVDDNEGINLIRFVNTSAQAVTLAGITTQPGGINLIAGSGLELTDNIAARAADLGAVMGLVADVTGNALYISSPVSGAIRAINLGTQNLTALGKTIEPGKIASIHTPNLTDFRALAVRSTPREFFFISERLVYRVDQNGAQTVFAGGGTPATGNGDGGNATAARLYSPLNLVIDNTGALLISDGGDSRNNIRGSIRKVEGTNRISTLIGNLAFPNAMSVAANNDVFVALGNAQQILRVISTGGFTMVGGAGYCDQATSPTCGDGAAATSARLSLPGSTDTVTLMIASDATGVYVPDFRYTRVRYINTSSGAVSVLGRSINASQIDTIVGSGEAAPFDNVDPLASELSNPLGVAADNQGNLYIADAGNNFIRFANRTSASIKLFAGTAWERTAPAGRIVSLNNDTATIAADDRVPTATFETPQGLVLTDKGLFIVDSQNGTRYPNGTNGKRSGTIRFMNLSAAEVVFYPNAGSGVIRVPAGHVKTIAGVPQGTTPPQTIGDGGAATRAVFFPTDVAVDAGGNIFIADQGNNLIRRIEAATGVISSLQEKKPDGSTAALVTAGATGVTSDTNGRVIVADTRNNRLLRQKTAGSTEWVVIADAGIGINRPRDLVSDQYGRIFVTSAGAQKVLQVYAPEDKIGEARAVAGTGAAGYSGDGGSGDQAQISLANPDAVGNVIQTGTGMALLNNGNLLVADNNNNRIRQLDTKALIHVGVSAASYKNDSRTAPDSIMASFGVMLSSRTDSATTVPLPKTLGGTTVRVRDSAGAERLADLFFVSPGQVNYLIPNDTAPGLATITITTGDGTISVGTLTVASVKPGLFAANSYGSGFPSGLVLHYNGANYVGGDALARYDVPTAQFTGIPIDVNRSPEAFLVLFGTGFRKVTQMSAITVTIGGVNAEALFAGAQGGFIGLDQLNIRVPRQLAGRGDVDVVISINGAEANTLKLNFR